MQRAHNDRNPRLDGGLDGGGKVSAFQSTLSRRDNDPIAKLAVAASVRSMQSQLSFDGSMQLGDLSFASSSAGVGAGASGLGNSIENSGGLSSSCFSLLSMVARRSGGGGGASCSSFFKRGGSHQDWDGSTTKLKEFLLDLECLPETPAAPSSRGTPPPTVPAQPPVAKKKVRFGQSSSTPRSASLTDCCACTYHPHIARADYTSDEVYDCWFDDDDHEIMEADVSRVVFALRQRLEDDGQNIVNDDDADDYDVWEGADTNDEGDLEPLCSRGLEPVFDPDIFERRMTVKFAVVEAVLKGQEAQRRQRKASEDGVYSVDDEALGGVSREVSAESRDRARQLAVKDAAVVVRGVAASRRRGSNWSTAVLGNPRRE